MRRRLQVRWAVACLAAVAVLAIPEGGTAQGPPPGVGPKGVKVRLSQTTVTFPTPGIADFDMGWVDASSLVVSVEPRGNQQGPWELRIRTDDVDMGGYGKPVTDILWRPAGSTTWTPLTNTDQAVAQGTGNQNVTVYLRLVLDYGFDLPNTYSADVTFYAETL